MPNPFLIIRNSCDHPLTSTDILNHDFCHPIKECICHHPWFYPVLIFGIIAVLIATCCCVKALRPTPWEEGNFVTRLYPRKGDKPSKVKRKSGGESEERVWPGMEMGGMKAGGMERSMRGEDGYGGGGLGEGRSERPEQSIRGERDRPYVYGTKDRNAHARGGTEKHKSDTHWVLAYNK
ncbi:MAG: hypothetical protein Q9209_002537 [Squamulea sp. 1 TL-2023]